MHDSVTCPNSAPRPHTVLAFWRQHWQWILIAMFGVAGVCFGACGYIKYFRGAGQRRSVLDICYFVLHLFVIESGEVSGPVPWELQIARLAAPLAAAGAVLKAGVVIFHEQLNALRLCFAEDHVVICGLGRKGMQLVEDFRRNGDLVVVIESDEQNDRIGLCRDLGAIVLAGDATDEAMLRKARAQRAKYVVAICGGDETNLGIAVRCHQLLRQQASVSDGTVRCFVQVVDLQLCRLLRGHPIFTETSDRFQLVLFNGYENSARSVLRDHPLDSCRITPDDARQVHLVVVGFGQMGQSVLLQAARTAHYANGKKPRITIVDL
ncbi:hypothetical protein LCGC14_2738630, partial [marine sediment metagenome]